MCILKAVDIVAVSGYFVGFFFNPYSSTLSTLTHKGLGEGIERSGKRFLNKIGLKGRRLPGD